jgi:excisionase family DNA binding protein
MSAPTNENKPDELATAFGNALAPLIRRIIREEIGSRTESTDDLKVLSVAQAAKATGFSEEDIYRAIRDGKLRTHTAGDMGTHIKIARKALQRWVDGHE